MRIGHYEVTSFQAGRFKLDGGSMFGSVPKPLWSREQPADEQNRIQLTARVLLLRGLDNGPAAGRLALVDCGCGTKWDEKGAAIFAIDNETCSLAQGLANAGVTPGEITDLVYTHLHFDHAGGGTTRDADGVVVPTFPNARYHLQRANLATAQAPNPRERASYLADNIDPIVATDRLVLADGAHELDGLPGLRAFLSNGHTAGLQGIEVVGGVGGSGAEANGPSLFFPADLMPTSSHLRLPYTMGFDLHAALVLNEKAALLRVIRPDHDLICFEHDPEVGVVRAAPGKKYWEITERVELS